MEIVSKNTGSKKILVEGIDMITGKKVSEIVELNGTEPTTTKFSYSTFQLIIPKTI